MTASRHFDTSLPCSRWTSWGASSWYFFGRWFTNMSGGSRMWSSTLMRIMSSRFMAFPSVGGGQGLGRLEGHRDAPAGELARSGAGAQQFEGPGLVHVA